MRRGAPHQTRFIILPDNTIVCFLHHPLVVQHNKDVAACTRTKSKQPFSNVSPRTAHIFIAHVSLTTIIAVTNNNSQKQYASCSALKKKNGQKTVSQSVSQSIVQKTPRSKTLPSTINNNVYCCTRNIGPRTYVRIARTPPAQSGTMARRQHPSLYHTTLTTRTKQNSPRCRKRLHGTVYIAPRPPPPPG